MPHPLLRGLARASLVTPLAQLIGRGRLDGADAGLDPQIAAVLALQQRLGFPELSTMAPVRARRYAEGGLAPLEVAPVRMAEVTDTTVDGPRGPIAVRIYVPFGAGDHWLVYFHGGGGVIGSIQGSEPITRLIAAQTGCTVASVAYRLAPEHKHPAGIEDACASWDALAARMPGAGKRVVAGDSFGGYLAAHVDRHARDGAHPVDLQLLIYPLTDLTMASPSNERFANGYLLTRAMRRWFHAHYLHLTDDPRAASPAAWPELDRSAAAIIATAGFDPLVDEGAAHAARLAATGTVVRHRHYPELIHGFLSLAGISRRARAAVDQLCSDVVAVLAR